MPPIAPNPKLVSLLKSMHASVLVKFEIDGVAKTLDSIIGVKQGSNEGPDLFIFYIAAIMETWRSEHSYDLCLMRSREDLQLTGRSRHAGGAADEFAVVDSEYADDTALAFCSRADVAAQAPNVMLHFERWGMEVHAGTYSPPKESKSEILFCPAPDSLYSDPTTHDGADVSDVLLPGGRFMKIVFEFKYLGSIISSSGDDAADVDSRIASAGKAFGALRGCIFSSTSISRKAKRAVYEVLVLSILLYGSESWSMTEKVLDRLRVFHARCVRAMSRVSRKHTWSEHIQTQQLEQELGLETIDLHVKRRQLRWLGHVRRMGFERLPRRMLSSWVNAPRPRGAPQMTYGRSITKALEMFNIDVRTWPELAADRAAWRETLRAGRPPPGFAPPPPPPPAALTRPRRAAAEQTKARIDEHLLLLAQQRSPPRPRSRLRLPPPPPQPQPQPQPRQPPLRRSQRLLAPRAPWRSNLPDVSRLPIAMQ